MFLYREGSELGYKNKTIGIIVPAYNEELLIADTLQSIPEYVDKIYVVDDCSKDNTFEIIGKLSGTDPRIIGIRHEVNKGVGAAIATGYKRALEDDINIAGVMAGDNQMDGKRLSKLLDPIVEGKADYTKGNRLMSSEFRKGMSKWRILGNIVLTFLTKMASGYWNLMDPQNGYSAISRNALKDLDISSLYPRYGYCNDILVKLNVYGFMVMDIAMPSRYGKEKSKIRYINYIPKVSWLLFRDFLWRLKMKYILFSFHPLVLFYILGFILMPIGISGIIFSLYIKFILGESLFVRGVLSLLLTIIGMQFLFFAMLFDMQVNSNLSLSSNLGKGPSINCI